MMIRRCKEVVAQNQAIGTPVAIGVRRRGGVHRYWRRTLLALALMFLTYELRQLLDQQVLIVHFVFDVVDPTVVCGIFFFAAVALLTIASAVA